MEVLLTGYCMKAGVFKTHSVLYKKQEKTDWVLYKSSVMPTTQICVLLWSTSTEAEIVYVWYWKTSLFGWKSSSRSTVPISDAEEIRALGNFLGKELQKLQALLWRRHSEQPSIYNSTNSWKNALAKKQFPWNCRNKSSSLEADHVWDFNLLASSAPCDVISPNMEYLPYWSAP